MLNTKQQYSVVYKSTVLNKSTDCCTPPTYILYMVCSHIESNSVLVASGDTTSVASPIRKRARPKYAWDAESPTKRLCLP